MENFKQFLAFPMYATAAWLLWVLSVQGGSMLLAHVLALLLALAFWVWASARCRASGVRLIAHSFALLVMIWSLYQVTQADMLSRAGQEIVQAEAFSTEKLESLRSEGKPVFVDVTAAWCLTCKYNELAVLQTAAMQQYFNERGIVTMVADWTKFNKEITDYLHSFSRAGVPLYVYYPPHGEPQILPQILTVDGVKEATQ